MVDHGGGKQTATVMLQASHALLWQGLISAFWQVPPPGMAQSKSPVQFAIGKQPAAGSAALPQPGTSQRQLASAPHSASALYVWQ
jgi:hypothetical protein